MREFLSSIRIVALGLFLIAPQLNAQVAGSCDTPVAQRTSETGCYLLDSVVVGRLPTTRVYWHIFRLAAADAAVNVPAVATTLDVFGARLVVAIAPREWTAPTGVRAALVGPLEVVPGTAYTARFMRSNLAPGIRTALHRHPGPEAWFLLEGRQCVETPAGSMIVRAGEGVHIPGGPPMQLMSPGPNAFRSLVLVLHDAERPWIDRSDSGWTPKGLCVTAAP